MTDKNITIIDGDDIIGYIYYNITNKYSNWYTALLKNTDMGDDIYNIRVDIKDFCIEDFIKNYNNKKCNWNDILDIINSQPVLFKLISYNMQYNVIDIQLSQVIAYYFQMDRLYNVLNNIIKLMIKEHTIQTEHKLKNIFHNQNYDDIYGIEYDYCNINLSIIKINYLKKFFKNCTNINIYKYLFENIVNIKDDNDVGYLNRACYSSTIDIIKYMVKRGANLECSSASGWRPIHYACQRGITEHVLYLMKCGVNLESTTNKRSNPIHLACLRCKPEIIKRLIYSGIDLECVTAGRNYDGWKPIHFLCMFSTTEMIRYIIDKEVNITAKITKYNGNRHNYGCVELIERNKELSGIEKIELVQYLNPLYINTCSKDELMAIKYIGEKIATQIIGARPYTTFDDIMKISGIGNRILDELKKYMEI